jgi:thiol-disulfide isomerase/thioredoxin
LSIVCNDGLRENFLLISIAIRNMSYIGFLITHCMKISLSLAVSICLTVNSFSQTPAQLITQVKEKQQQLKTVYFNAERHDTLVMGTVRTMKGESRITLLPSDTILGFKFWSKKDDGNSESIYDGRTAFDIDHTVKSFSTYTTASMIPHILDSRGAQVIFPDLVLLDTSTATGFELTEDPQYYYLKMRLPDITLYDVVNRYKTVMIDKKLLLPIGVRKHQETLGKVQDLNYRIKDIRINNPEDAYNFSSQRYPDDYKKEAAIVNKKLFALNGKPFIPFQLTRFDGKDFSSDLFKDKLVLLDFWEVWCGACITSLPKVQALYEKYKDRGLQVYGIIHEKENLETAKLIAQKRKITLPMLLGDKQSKKNYSINAVPVYILIGKTGKIIFVTEGYPENLEEEIMKGLGL